jgi:hypothetical protein
LKVRSDESVGVSRGDDALVGAPEVGDLPSASASPSTDIVASTSPDISASTSSSTDIVAPDVEVEKVTEKEILKGFVE